MAEAWCVTFQRKGFIRDAHGGFALWGQWTLVSWSWKVVSEVITCWKVLPWGQHMEAVVLAAAETAHQAGIQVGSVFPRDMEGSQRADEAQRCVAGLEFPWRPWASPAYWRSQDHGLLTRAVATVEWSWPKAARHAVCATYGKARGVKLSKSFGAQKIVCVS